MLINNFQNLGNRKKYFENMINYLNELHGWMTQWPAVFWRIRSLTNAFLLPNNFIANRLSVGWNHDCNWFFKKFDDIFSLIVCKFGNSSSLGVPYNETSSKWTYNISTIDVHEMHETLMAIIQFDGSEQIQMKMYWNNDDKARKGRKREKK